MSITGQIDLTFNPAEKRDSHGRWTRGGLAPSDLLRVKQHNARRMAGNTWTVQDGKIVHGAHPGVPLAGIAREEQRVRDRLAAAGRGPSTIERLINPPATSFEFIGPHGSLAGQAFLPGNAEPRIGDMARDGQGVIGRVIGKGGGHAVIDAEDGRRYLVDWRNGGQVRQAGPQGEPVRRVTPQPSSAGESTWDRIQAREAAKLAKEDRHPQIGTNGHLVQIPKFRAVGIELDPNPPNPLAPWLVHRADGGEFHVNAARAEELRAELRRDRAAAAQRRPAPSPAGDVIQPGVKQYILPGMEDVPGSTVGHNSPPVVELRKLLPQVSEALTPGSGKGKVTWPQQGAQGAVAVVELPTGTKVVTKSQDPDRNDREELSYYVSQAIGANLSPVVRDPASRRDIVEGFVEGTTASRYLDEQVQEGGEWSGYTPEDVEQELESTSEGQQIGLLDYLTSNSDRHEANWMVTKAGVPVPIDMGMAQFNANDYSSPFWTGEQGEWDSADVADMRRELAKIQPEFIRTGHPDWYANMIYNLGALSGDEPSQDEFNALLEGVRDRGPGPDSSLTTAERGAQDRRRQAMGMSVTDQVGIELAFNPHEPRDTRGRWTRFGGVERAADTMAKEREGFSVSPFTGDQPPPGYMVAQVGATHTYPEQILDDHAALTRAIDDMLMSNPEVFTAGGGRTYLGGWVHDGKLWLEPSDHFDSKDAAVQAGRSRNQIAIFDLHKFEEIDTGGSGGGRITEHDIRGRPLRTYTEGAGGGAVGLSQYARIRAPGGGRRAGPQDPGRPAGGISGQLIDLAFDPFEPRDRRGRWSVGGHSYELPEHGRLASTRSPYKHPEQHPFFVKNPVSPANVIKSYDASTPQEKAQGMRWYSDAALVASAIGQGNPEMGAAMLSVYSPQTPWPANMFNAARSVAEGRAMGPKDGMITRATQAKAQRIMGGSPIATEFKSPKTYDFARLLQHAGDEQGEMGGHVVIDRHALSVAVGRRMTKDELDDSPVSDARYYQLVADQYRQASEILARDRGIEIAPHQLQAITWLHQQNANTAHDAGTGARLDRGRNRMLQNAWTAWDHFADEHEIPVRKGTTELSVFDQLLEGSVTAQLDLTGDGHGHHIPGTPMVYRHGWQPLAPEEAGQAPIDQLWNHLQGEAAAASDDGEDEVSSLITQGADFLAAGNHPRAYQTIKQAAWLAGQRDGAREKRLDAYAAQISVVVGNVKRTNRQVAQKFVADTAETARQIVGADHSRYNGQMQVITRVEAGDTLADTGWRGEMNIREDVAAELADDLASPRKPARPDPVVVILHEQTHALGASSDSIAQDEESYTYNPVKADIEEGNTELGAVLHAGDFFRKLRMGSRPTTIRIPFLGGASARPYTWSEYARYKADFSRIRNGDAWGHYPQQTARALDWAVQIARAEGVTGRLALHKRVTELVDEINRVGTEGKVHIMANQITRASGARPVPGRAQSTDGTYDEFGHPPGIMSSKDWNTLEDVIQRNWAAEGGGAAVAASRHALAARDILRRGLAATAS